MERVSEAADGQGSDIGAASKVWRTCRRHPNGLDVSHVKVRIEQEIVLRGRRCPSFNDGYKEEYLQHKSTRASTSFGGGGFVTPFET